MAVLWKSRRRTSLTALASPHSSSHLHLRCPPFFIWHCSFDRSWHQHCQQITKRFETALKNVSKTRPGLWILSRLSRIPIILHFLSLSTRPPLLSPPPPPFITFLPSLFIILYHVAAYPFLANQSSAACFFFFLFGVCILYSLPCCLWLPSVALRESKMLLCISPTFCFIHSLALLLLLPSSARGVHVASQTDVQWQHSTRAVELGQRGTCVSCIHLCWVFLSYPFWLLFFSWSIYHKLCKLSQRGDRRPVRALLRNRQASQGAHCCSGHVCWSTALQQLHIAGLPSPLHHPASLRGALPHSFASKLLFLRYSRSWKAGVARRDSSAASPPPPRYWSGLEKPRRFDISNTRLKRASQPAPARAFNFPIAYLVFHVWGKFGERSYASRDNMQLYDPPGFIQAHLGGDRVSALHYRVNYTSICLGLLYGYLWLCSKSKMISLKSRLSDITVFSPFWLRVRV